MYCFQCEQGAGGACVKVGACGKPALVGDLHDELFHVAQRVAATTDAALQHEEYLEAALFATMTNVNYDATEVAVLIRQGREIAAAAKASGGAVIREFPPISTRERLDLHGKDLVGMQEILGAGIKGLAAISRQSRALGRVSPRVGPFLVEALNLLAKPATPAETLLDAGLRCGDVALEAMEILDQVNHGHFGHPEPTEVAMGHCPGQCILVSGHELDQLERVLEQTAGLGINVYTHGEMLSAHGYPQIKHHPHLAGHYGGAWHDQRESFAIFPGAVVMTGGCLVPPLASYRERMFTVGATRHAELQHLADGDFRPAIAAAQAMPGFSDTHHASRHRVGFGHRATLGVVDLMAGAVREGAIKRFVLIGGCDGPTSGRDYYSDLAAALPRDWAVLTLGCGKFRVLGHSGGNIGSLPRLLDVGQCSDSFSAIKIVGALAEKLGVPATSVPLSMVLSWHEQKAVTILLALLKLGMRDIRIGPRMPAYVTPAILAVLTEKFGLLPIASVAEDIHAMAAQAA
ncbi:MAG: hydroxylamine reductase [Sulfuricella sp.]|nr:hydroxylamine reductase [Sulfuricella sp.]